MHEPLLQSSRVDESNIGLPTEVTAPGKGNMDMSSVGCLTCRGTDEGPNGEPELKTNQDFACTARPFHQIPGTALFCVCDGHGRQGHLVSQEVRAAPAGGSSAPPSQRRMRR
eukprot:5675082-Prymnesium_polylepis.1